jgi:TonB family protein
VGPRKVDVASTGRSIGTGKLQIGGEGSSVREGVISNRDVVGSPTGAPLVSIDTAVGDGLLRGSGGSGDSIRPGGPAGAADCTERTDVRNYLAEVERRTYDRWVLPPGIDPDQEVVLRFKLDAAGSAVTVSVVKSSDNALGASAVDALRAAAPFPPMSGDVRCLAGLPIVGKFKNEKKKES